MAIERDRYARKSFLKCLSARLRYLNQVFVKINIDAFVGKTFRTKHTLRAAENICHHGQHAPAEIELADFDTVDCDSFHDRRTRYPDELDLVRRLRRNSETISDGRNDCGTVGASVEHQTKWSLAIDLHRSPNSPNPVKCIGCDILRLIAFDQDIRPRRLRIANSWRRGWNLSRAKRRNCEIQQNRLSRAILMLHRISPLL